MFVLLDAGVGLALPCWWTTVMPPGQEDSGVDAARGEGITWYIDLLHVTDHAGEVIVRDLYIDVMVSTDGRH